MNWLCEIHRCGAEPLASRSGPTGFYSIFCRQGHISLVVDLASSGEVRGAGFRKALVVSQVAFSPVLLIAAGLFIRTLANLRPTGYHVQPDRVLLFTMKPQKELYSSERIQNLTSEMVRQISALPGSGN